MTKAGEASTKITAAPFTFGKKNKVLATKMIPTGIHETMSSPPSLTEAKSQRTKTVECQWGRTGKMRCTEVVIGILNDPTRADHYYAAALCEFSETRRTLINERFQQFYEDILWYQK